MRTQLMSWRSLFIVAASAVLTVVAIDVTVRLVWAPHHLEEVADAVERYRTSDPTVLVLGSSHARTFSVVGRRLYERTAGSERILAVPLEWGKLTGYAWVLENRLRPLIEERRRDGSRVRPSLARFVLVTEWWDSCAPVGLEWNIPSRAWTTSHFLDDVARHGYNSYNRNVVYSWFTSALRASTLVSDRGQGRVRTSLKRALRGAGPRAEEEDYRARTEGWQRMVESGESCIAHDAQMKALSRILDYAQGAGLETTLLLYPRKPATLTDAAKQGTLAHFHDIVEVVAQERGIRLVDMTTNNPLSDDDYAADFDHVTPDGNEKLARWALDGPLRFLERPAVRTARNREVLP